MRNLARLILERGISRRAFVSRLTKLGVASSAASGLARSLTAAPSSSAAQPGRIVRDMTGGELMAEFLMDWDVPYVFGLGGSEEVGFLDALVDRLSLQYVQALHEGSVMAMADGYARASGRTTFVNLHSVAGAGYALGQMVNAFKDRTPVVVTVGRQSTDLRGSEAFLEAVNLHQLPRDYARWTWDLLDAGTMPEVLRRAFLFARVPPGGPTFVTVSKDLFETRVAEAEILPPSRSQPDETLAPDRESVARAVDMLVAADFPVLVAGREINRYGGAAQLGDIAELLGVPVFMDVDSSHTPVVFPIEHPLYAGLFRGDPDFPPDFDLFWSVGGTMFGVGVAPPEPLVPRSVSVIHTGIDAFDIGRNYPVDLPMTANPALATAAILEELRTRTLPSAVVDARRSTARQYHDVWRRRVRERADAVWDNRPVAGERLASELNRRLDSDAIVVSELVTSEPLLKSHLELRTGSPGGQGTGRRNFTSRGGVLGWGVAAAIGAKIARPDRQVAALVGDGSFQFGVQSLWSAVRYEVPVAVIIWNNGGYQANRRFLHAYGGRAAVTGKYVGASLGSPDIDHVAIARGYGVEGEAIDDPAALGSALDRCLGTVASGRPYVLDVRIERRFGGADSTWHDFFSVARRQPRSS